MRRGTWVGALAVLVTLGLLVAPGKTTVVQSSTIDIADYVLLDQGRYWDYEGIDNGSPSSERCVVDGTRMLHGRETARKVYRETGADSGSDVSWESIDPNGWWVHEQEESGELWHETCPLDEPLMILPRTVAVGETYCSTEQWNCESESPGGTYSVTALMERCAEIVGMETISVPYGEFEALRIEETLIGPFYIAGEFEWLEGETETGWHVEGVGNIKWQYEEVAWYDPNLVGIDPNDLPPPDETWEGFGELTATGVCGNDSLEPGEQCDDGNRTSCDGCSTDCRVEMDTDTDGTADSCDNCPSVKNADQADGDGDQIGDACDNCRKKANAEPIPAGHLATGGQTDDDLDGIGNVCDADFDGSDFVNVLDLIRFLSAFGSNISENDCLDEAGNSTMTCACYDLNLAGPVVNVEDLLFAISDELFGKPTEGCAPDDSGTVQCPLECSAGVGAVCP
jgi:cysteine-rich repeat protein